MLKVKSEPCQILKKVSLISVGDFGKSVASHLNSFFPQLGEASDNNIPDRDSEPAPDLCILVSWRPVPALCDSLDCFAFTRRRPFIPLIVDSSVLCLGPVIVPGLSGCWRCWEQRMLQHSKASSHRAVLQRSYDSQPEAGPAGYLESFALLGAARIAELLGSRDAIENAAGQIWRMDLFSTEISMGQLIGVDNCDRCGLGRNLRDRTYAELRENLSFLWEE
jgi:bacteriocin biosynthesis cyclodehydratase domain-containing protein